MPVGSYYQSLVLRYIERTASAANTCRYCTRYLFHQNAQIPSVRSPFKHFNAHTASTQPGQSMTALHSVLSIANL